MSEYIVNETGYPGTLTQTIVGELVRCRDCKWFHEHEMENPFCGQGVFLNYPRRDDYCSYGVRRNG